MMMEKSSVCAVVKPKLAAEQPLEQLPCPRCHSTNTKFCYYNNYNFSQPRHFCKSCRRYWTHGGTLRDIPIGGGSRKSAKRCRTSASYNSASSSGVVTPSSSSSSHEFLNSTPVFLPSSAGYGGVGGGGFTSLLTGNHGPGVWALGGGFGLGLGSGLVEDTSFGLGKGGWAFGDVGYGGSHSSASVVGGGGNVGGATWQLESGENGGFVAGSDCFGWPELAISTPGSLSSHSAQERPNIMVNNKGTALSQDLDRARDIAKTIKIKTIYAQFRERLHIKELCRVNKLAGSRA